ncbi:MAG: reverse transcriptase domain-containing protein [Actinomycetota bacterium]|nr:reverse transcriptase domain-containing protein [Actinomycetota bacterium]
MLEPVFEADFRTSSYGFRPKRNAHQALEVVRQAVNHGQNWVVDADIQAFFDEIDHAVLEKLVARRICDRRLLKLLRQWQRAGVLDGGDVVPTEQGISQGSMITPPTTLHNRRIRVGADHAGANAEDDIHVLLVDLDALHEGADELALCRPVRMLEPLRHRRREVAYLTDDESKLLALCRSRCEIAGLRL